MPKAPEVANYQDWRGFRGFFMCQMQLLFAQAGARSMQHLSGGLKGDLPAPLFSA